MGARIDAEVHEIIERLLDTSVSENAAAVCKEASSDFTPSYLLVKIIKAKNLLVVDWTADGDEATPSSLKEELPEAPRLVAFRYKVWVNKATLYLSLHV